jgi:hypothetical protein
MGTRDTGNLPARLEGVRRRFERWRATRRGRTRIPDTLWASAALVADTFGISRTARVLRVNPSRLKKCLVQKLAASVPELEGGPRFVELGLLSPNGSCECLLELEDGNGAKIRIELKGIAAADLAALSQGLWNRQP